MSNLAGQGDPAVSMSLLWAPAGDRATATPGPKPGLSVDLIVEAGISVADTASMAGLSMRAVAERLGRTSMALYTYVPGKAELLDLMYDRAHAELGGPRPPEDGWRPGVLSWVAELKEFYLRHPWVLQVSYARAVLGPNEQAVLETLLDVLFTTGLPADVLRGVVGSLFHYVRGFAQTIAETALAAATQEDWWRERSGMLDEVAPDFAERFPLSVRLGRETAAGGGGREWSWERQLDATFDAGLTVILDGVEAAVRAQGVRR
ncbi:TetR/AcrR family transcriptional regulator C-terminal domain-containing protein [Phytomonospora sp. NPDC050363]|uniref:TetR/AcrR family transcriptional regulator n=1 Tax=Phytomonospora sp. NPDC050363 TaxID=3155642 RepID=UPI00340FA577